MNARMFRAAIVSPAILVTVAGCGPQAAVDPPHTVPWYMAHKEERVSKQRWCAEDAGRQGSPDCLNAVEADQKVMMQPNARTSSDNLKFP